MRIMPSVAILGWLGACGGSSTPSRPDSGSAIDGGTTIDSGTTTGPCPTAQPAAAGSCPRVGLVCEYGSDPRGDSCRITATCAAGGWTIDDPMCPAPPPPTGTCPATRTDAAGQACSPMDAFCSYPDGLSCHCTNCTTGPSIMCSGQATWHCQAPNADPACPAAAQNQGSACATEGQACTYMCGADGKRTCTGGVWVSGSGGPCPVSTRRAKQDIEYLGDADLARIAAELGKFRLATYRYKDPAVAKGRRLGFIIEDVPGSPAVDAEHDMVDLYGYTSMVVAAMQSQQRELAALREEVAELRRLLHRSR